MTTPNGNSPAHPVIYWDHLQEIGNVAREQFFGLTKREEFAKAMLPPLILAGALDPSCSLNVHHTGDKVLHGNAVIGAARLAVEIADALLAELEKEAK